MKLKKVLIITYYWPPSGGAGVQRWVKFAKYLPDFGIEPIILTIEPKHASYPIIDNTLEQEIADTIKVYRTRSREPYKYYLKISGSAEIPHSGFANQTDVTFFGKISRFVRGNLFIPDSRKGWNKFALAEARKLIVENNISTVFTTSPPHSTQLIGLELKKQFNINWIADLRDPWTDIHYYDKLYHTAWAKKVDERYESSVIQKADKVVVVSKAIKRQFLAKSADLNESKFSVIPNGYDEDDFKRKQQPETNQFVITYTGTIAANYDIEGFLNALLRLSEKENSIVLRFVGVVSENFKKIIRESSLHNLTEFIEHVKHDVSINYLLKSTVLFLAIPNAKNNEGVLTGKLFEYLAAKKPIVAVGPVNGDAAEIIQLCESGKVFHYYDENQIYEYLHRLYMNWVKHDIENYGNKNVSLYSRKNLTKNLALLLKE